MSYSSVGKKPFEKASKSSHHHIINDEVVQSALNNFYIPDVLPEVSISSLTVPHNSCEHSLKHVVAIDGGYTEIPLKIGYPSASLHFFNLELYILKQKI